MSTKSSKSTTKSSVAPFVFAAFTGDRSGSMRGIYQESAIGLYEWAVDLIESTTANNQSGKMFITCFDNEMERRLDNVDFKNINITQVDCMEWMYPRGSTRLYDTAIEDLDNIIQKAKEFKRNLPRAIKCIDPEISIVWACCTDGFDNESTHTAEDLKEKVLWARGEGVKCFFLAANQDAIETGKMYGFSPEKSMTYTADSEHTKMAFRSVSKNMRQSSCGESGEFSQVQRESSQSASYSTSPSSRASQTSQSNQAIRHLTNRQKFYLSYVGSTAPPLVHSPSVNFGK